MINPEYTSQRCSKCGYIDSENRKTQAQFICLKCGFEENADYNASQNIALKDIEKIIKKKQNQKVRMASEHCFLHFSGGLASVNREVYPYF